MASTLGDKKYVMPEKVKAKSTLKHGSFRLFLHSLARYNK